MKEKQEKNNKKKKKEMDPMHKVGILFVVIMIPMSYFYHISFMEELETKQAIKSDFEAHEYSCQELTQAYEDCLRYYDNPNQRVITYCDDYVDFYAQEIGCGGIEE